MSFQAYTQTIKTTENSRSTEYRLFAEITSELIDAGKSGKKDAPLAEALNRNRQMWQALANDCRAEGNGLPEALRASIISLSIWVTKYSGQVLRESEDIQELVEVNRIIMKGLSPQRDNPGSQAQAPVGTQNSIVGSSA